MPSQVTFTFLQNLLQGWWQSLLKRECWVTGRLLSYCGTNYRTFLFNNLHMSMRTLLHPTVLNLKIHAPKLYFKQEFQK
jgi:hypothetical protein